MFICKLNAMCKLMLLSVWFIIMHDLFILLTQFKRVVKSDNCDVQGDRKVSVETFEANMCFLGKNMLNQCFCQLC